MQLILKSSKLANVCYDIRGPVLDRAKAASLRTQWGFRQLEENPEGLAQANAHIRVPIGPPKSG